MANFLYEKLNNIREAGFMNEELPLYISDNLNPTFELRPYQKEAYCNFINYFESDKLCQKPTQVLFHMATGSGITLIMAGLVIYLYKQGYGIFLFFVNLDNIVKKTEENFLNGASNKYLFADEIKIEGETVAIKKVNNFQGADSDSINICFTTVQGLHSDLWNVKENSLSIDDFREQKIVLISDEAHHLNADTKKGKKGSDDDNEKSWEYTVNRLWYSNRDNILLEFTATCNLENPFILSEYENKIIFDYPLKKFREEGYSKEVKAIRSDSPIIDRALQALILSQYRLKVFQDYRLDIKPVVLLKAKTIAESEKFKEEFRETIRTLNGSRLESVVSANSENIPPVKAMSEYFASKGVDYDELAQELKEEFSEQRCISVNDDKEANQRQIILNSLEEKDNPYRAIFEVKKLDEGWDVLNLFDIVRLYETRDAKNGVPGKGTIAEAQLIGRGARYCPFKINEDDEKYKRKFDKDLENALRVCEELYYHCQYDSRYIDELHKALVETGIVPEKAVDVRYTLKADFKEENFYKTGFVFRNERRIRSRKDINEILPSIRNHEYPVSINTGRTGIDTLMLDKHDSSISWSVVHTVKITDIAKDNYSLLHRAFRHIDVFKFNRLQSYFPNLHTAREFLTSTDYLGGVSIAISTSEKELSQETLYQACLRVLTIIGNEISSIKMDYEGTAEFYAKPFREVIKDKTIHITEPHGEGEGVSQKDSAIRSEWQIDLISEEWFAFEDNYGTTEEKAFVAYFKNHVADLQKKYDKVFLVRNERQLVLYSFEGGERFEPDYLLFLIKNNTDGFDQYQIFVEPKGDHLINNDKWKEDFLLQIKDKGIPPKTFVDDNNYKVWGLPFFNQNQRKTEFNTAFQNL
ncbi:MAG: DEAD/DEAH box helicase family protein [Clostridiales bacterium]|nr:DEAD/DEAH box helicase family protein [Clostridiales bacterium]